MHAGIGEVVAASDDAFTIDDDKLVMELVAAGEAWLPLPVLAVVLMESIRDAQDSHCWIRQNPSKRARHLPRHFYRCNPRMISKVHQVLDE